MSNKQSEPEIIVSVYGSKDAPAAARFGVGAQTLREVEEATRAGDDLVDQQSRATSGPVRRD